MLLLLLLLGAAVQLTGAPVQLTGSQVADLQVVGRWPTFQVASLASEVLWNRSNSSALPQVSASLYALRCLFACPPVRSLRCAGGQGEAGRAEEDALRAVIARLCDEASDAAGGAATAEVASPETMWVGGARAWASHDPCSPVVPGRALVSCRGSCIPRAQCYPAVRLDPCSLLGASGGGFTECRGGCAPRGRCVHVVSTPSFELSAYVGEPSALENRSLGGGALMLPPGTLGVWNETAARLATMSFFNFISRRWEFNASAVEPSAPPPVAVCVVRWHGNYMPRRRGLRQQVVFPLPDSAYQPSRALVQNVTVQTEVVSLLVRGAWSEAEHGAAAAFLESEPPTAHLLLPAVRPLPEDGRAPAREQRGVFRYCGRWGSANATNSTHDIKLSHEWLLDQLEGPEVVTELTARTVGGLPAGLLPVVRSSNCTNATGANATGANATGANATNLTACHTTEVPPALYEYDRTDEARCRIPIGESVSSELLDIAVRALHFPLSHSFPHTNLKSPCAEQVLAGATRWAPIVPLNFAYMVSRPELNSTALLVSICSFVLYGAALAGSIQFRRTIKVRSPKLTVAFSQSSYILITYRVVAIKARRAAIPGWLKQTAYARQLKHDLHPVLSVRTVLHTLRTRWSLPAATLPGPVAGDPFDFSQRVLVVITAAMAALGSTAALGSAWRHESCLAPCSAQCYSQTEVSSTAPPLSWTIRTDRHEAWHRDQFEFGDCDEVCGTRATVPVQLPPVVIGGGVLCAQLTCSALSVLFRWLAEPYLEYLAPEHVESVTVRGCRWFREWLPVAATFDFCGAVRRELVEICHVCWHRKPRKRLYMHTKRGFEGRLPVRLSSTCSLATHFLIQI